MLANADDMKKKRSPDLDDDLRPEYGSELFSKMKPNRFVGMDLQFKNREEVPLDEDVADVCDDCPGGVARG